MAEPTKNQPQPAQAQAVTAPDDLTVSESAIQDDAALAAAEDERQAESAYNANLALLQEQRDADKALRDIAVGNKDKKRELVPIADARKAGISLEDLSGIRQTKKLLDDCDKVRIMIGQNPRGQKPKDDVIVTINDYSFVIKPGYIVSVPLPVAEILVNSGHILPMDERLMAFQRDLEPEIESLKIKYM